MDIDLKSTHYTEAFPVQPLTIADVQKVAPIGVHIKELNQIAPLLVESLRVDHVRHIDPLKIEQLDITRLPSVNITMSQLPSLDLNVRRVPPVTIALQQQFGMTSDYMITARLLGLPLLRMALQGTTKITPRDCSRREQSRSHERSFPDVAAAGNPAIPSRAIEVCCQTVIHKAPPCRGGSQTRAPKRPVLHAGSPRFDYSLREGPAKAAAAMQSSVNFGG